MSRPAAGTLFAFLLGTGSCGLLTGPDRGDQLTAARRLWLTEGPFAYWYEVRRDCYCPNGGRWALIEVSGERVVAASWLDTGVPVEPQYLFTLPTVPMLFDDIERAVAQQAVVLEASYDAVDGHPVHINVDVSRNVIDEEFAVQTRNLQTPLTAPALSPR